MTFNALNMLHGTEILADALDKNASPSEYDYRNYCGRAYYTAYHLVTERLDKDHGYLVISTTNSSYTNKGTHKRLTDFLLDHINIPSTNYHKDYKRLVLRLKNLTSKRVHADYHLDKPMKDVDYHQAKTQLDGIAKLVTVTP